MTLTTPSRGAMADFDIEPAGPLRVGIELGDHVWLDSPGDIARIRAVDLRDLAHKAAAVRAERPQVTVLADIEVMIACDAHSAREALAANDATHDPDTLLYVGTPAGLAGLIIDIHALGMADGAVLIPLGNRSVLDLIREQVLPELQTLAA